MSKLTLSQSESGVLAAIQLRAAAPLSTIANECGHREHTVRYTVSKFLEHKVLKKRPIINLSKLGYTDFVVYIAVAHATKKQKLDFEQHLLATQNLGDVFELGGEYRYGLVYCCKDAGQASDYVARLAEENQVQIFEQVIGIRVTSVVYRRKYLLQQSLQGATKIVNRRSTERVEVDKLDLDILAALHDQHTSYRDLARQLGVSHSTFTLRLRNLYAKGVILGEVYGIDSMKFGMSCYRLLVFLRRASDSLRTLIFAFCEKHPAVVICNEVFGSWNFEILAEVHDSHEIVDVVQALYEVVGDSVASIKTLPVFNFLKVCDFPVRG